MPRRIAISAAKKFAQEQDCRQVIMLALDNDLVAHCVTWGKSVEDCAQAADYGNRIKAAAGWPPETQAEPSRVRKLKDEITALKAENERLLKGLQAVSQILADLSAVDAHVQGLIAGLQKPLSGGAATL